MRSPIDNFRFLSLFSWILGRFWGPTWSQNPIKIWKNVGSERVPKFIPFSGWFLSDFSIKNDRKIDADLIVFLLFFRSAENAGNTINTMVSEVSCISESIKNYVKIDEKTQVKLIMEKVRKTIQKWIQNWSQEPLKIEKIEVQDASKFLSFFSTVF